MLNIFTIQKFFKNAGKKALRLFWVVLLFSFIVGCVDVFLVVLKLAKNDFGVITVNSMHFLIASFLIAEGCYKIIRHKDENRFGRIAHLVRIFVGVNMFMIHLHELFFGLYGC